MPSYLFVAILGVLIFSIFNFRPKGKAKCFAGDVGSIGIAFIILFALGRRCEMSKSEHAALNNVEGHFHFMPYDFCCLETMIVEGTK